MISGKYFVLESDNRLNTEINISGWSPLLSAKGGTNNSSSVENMTIYLLSGYGNMYVGFDSRNARPVEHKGDLIHNYHRNNYLQSVSNKYGISGFYYQVLTKIPPDLSGVHDQIENSYIKHFDTYHNGYNLCEFADSPNWGKIVSAETRKKQSNSNKTKHAGKILNSDGNIIEFESIMELSKKLGIDRNGLNGIINGKGFSYKEFRKFDTDFVGIKFSEDPRLLERLNNNIGVKTGKFYKVISPNGDLLTIKNLTKFCIENNLNYKCFARIFSKTKNNKRGSYRGYINVSP